GVAEDVEQVVEIAHHERLADRAVHQMNGVVEERTPLGERLARERRVDVIALERLAVVPLAVDAGRLDVADAVEVDAEARRRRVEGGTRLEQLSHIQHAVDVLPADDRVALRILMEAKAAQPYRQHPAIARVKRLGKHAAGSKLDAIDSGPDRDG